MYSIFNSNSSFQVKCWNSETWTMSLELGVFSTAQFLLKATNTISTLKVFANWVTNVWFFHFSYETKGVCLFRYAVETHSKVTMDRIQDPTGDPTLQRQHKIQGTTLKTIAKTRPLKKYINCIMVRSSDYTVMVKLSFILMGFVHVLV